MDTIGNMLTSIITAQRIKKIRVAVPHSKHKEDLARILKAKGYLAALRVQAGPKPTLIMTLAYNEDGSSQLHGVKRISTPGQRRYAAHDDIPYSLDGAGTIIISSSQGLIDDSVAREQGIGGELVCEVW